MERPDSGTLKIVIGTVISAVFFTFGTYVHKVNKDSFSRSYFRFNTEYTKPAGAQLPIQQADNSVLPILIR